MKLSQAQKEEVIRLQGQVQIAQNQLHQFINYVAKELNVAPEKYVFDFNTMSFVSIKPEKRDDTK